MPEIDQQVLAEQYGFALAILQSNPELNDIFNKAVAETWTADKFVASVRNTNWYKSTSETARVAQTLKQADPATYNSQLTQVRARVGMMAAEYGARMSQTILNHWAEQAFLNGWDDNQLRQTLSGYVRFTKDGEGYGQAGQWATQIRDYARDMGLTFSDKTVQSWVTQAVRGDIVVEDAFARVRQLAKSRYAAFADRLEAGETMQDIADPYIQSMKENWELGDVQKGIMDPMIQRALQHTDDKTGQPTTQPLWQFEAGLRKHRRFQGTQKAQDSYMETGRQVLRDFGLTN